MSDQEPKNENEITERNSLRRKGELSDLRTVLGYVEGRRLLWRLLEVSGVFRSSFNQNALVMAFNEGQRNVGNSFLMEINDTMPGLFQRMQAEHVSDMKAREAERAKRSKEKESE